MLDEIESGSGRLRGLYLRAASMQLRSDHLAAVRFIFDKEDRDTQEFGVDLVGLDPTRDPAEPVSTRRPPAGPRASRGVCTYSTPAVPLCAARRPRT